MPKSSRRGAQLSAEAIAEHALAASGHLVPVGRQHVAPARVDDPEAIAKAAARAVLEEHQHELDRMEPVLQAMTAVIAEAL
jgi:hypothetical protein